MVGLLPWLLTGMRLPLQNLWAAPTTPEDMPMVMLPLNQYYVTVVLALVVTGYGVAGLVVRALGARVPPRAVAAVGAGALAVHLVATVQSMAAVTSGLAGRAASVVYLAALLALVVGAVLVGSSVLALITARPRGAAVVGLSVLGLALGPWSATSVPPPDTGAEQALSWVLADVVRWIPAVVVGVAIAWGGLGRLSRVAAALGALLVLWIGSAALTAVSNAAGSRALLRHPAELLAYASEVFEAALLQRDQVVASLLVAVVVAAGGTALHHLFRPDGVPTP